MFLAIKKWLEVRGIYWHSQNLNEDSRGRIKGSKFWNGRAWLYLPHPFSAEKRKHHQSIELGFEWSFRWRQSIGVNFHTNDERAVLNLHFGFLSLYPSVTNLLTTRNWRDTGIEWHGGYLWLNFYHDDDGWAKGWNGLHLAINFADLLLGRKKHSDIVIETVRAVVPMPEGSYPATITFHERTAKRPRWFTDRYITANIKPDEPIGIPGKGENSWDCDDDALFEMSCGASTVPEAIAAMVQSALRTRGKYGWSDKTVQYASSVHAMKAQPS